MALALALFAAVVSLTNAVLLVLALQKNRVPILLVEAAKAEGRGISTARPVNLTEYCNYHTTNSSLIAGNTNHLNHLGELPLGTTNYAGVRFSVNGIIQLGSRESVHWRPPHPAKAEGIIVASKCQKIHMLHGTGFWAQDGLPVAMLVAHYADGQERKFPVVYGLNVRDWWITKSEPAPALGTEIAWVGENAMARQMKAKLRLYRTTFENPLPEVEITSFDYVSTLSRSAPFLCGLSLE